MADDIAAELSEKLDVIQRLLAALVAAQYDTLQERAVTLRSLGLTPAEIAKVCNTDRNTVSVRLAEARRKKKPARRRKG